MTLHSIDPTTGQIVKTYTAFTESQVQRSIELASIAYEYWSRTSFTERTTCMQNAAQILRQRVDEFADLMADEMGKPVRDGRLEIEKCADACDFFAQESEGMLQSQSVILPDKKSKIVHRPIGVILAVMPWNFPFWQVFRFLAPALMAGNVGLLKHASNVPGCAIAIEEVMTNAGFPSGVMQSLLIGSEAVNAVIEHPAICAVTLTGGSHAGQQVAAKAGSLLKKTVLELGGSDPYIILADADLAKAVPICVTSRLTNSGQSCIAAKRFIVVDAVRAEFEAQFVVNMQERRLGHPREETTEIGPQARTDLRDALHEQVTASIATGARCLLGGKNPGGPGAYYPPTVLTDVRPGMPAYDEELFGPVAAIIPVADEAEAIRVANDTAFGLGAAIFTADVARGEIIATEHIQAGTVVVNGQVKSDVHLPFGGIKSSGYGRELSEVGIKEFINIKVVSLG
ncbi:MAG: NAD-dependent succinate-semialdehyde dehydrogenase [Pseudomonadota bacterium]|nr:NAD-dependent succinate-semialdehyde dehydrogenase [Pseudomonadota bacterium]